MAFMILKIDNSKEAAIMTGKWKNPGAKLYDQLLDATWMGDNIPESGKELEEVIDKGEYKQWQHYLREAYAVAPISKMKNNGPYGRTPYSRSGCKYPHHVIQNVKSDNKSEGRLVLSLPGLKVAWSRAWQQKDSEAKKHIEKHMKELNITHEFHHGQLYWNEAVNSSDEPKPQIIAPEILKEMGKTPKSIFEWMKKNLSYDKRIHGWKLKNLEETIKEKKGNCHDQSYFSTFLLHSNGIVTGQLFFIEFSKKSHIGGNTHTLTWYKENNKYYWMETAWEDQAKIHGPFKSIDELKEYILSIYRKDNDINSHKFDGIVFSSFSSYKLGMSLGEYVESWRLEDDHLFKVNQKIQENFTFIESFIANRNPNFQEALYLDNYIGERLEDALNSDINYKEFKESESYIMKSTKEKAVMEQVQDDLEWIERYLMEEGENEASQEEEEKKSLPKQTDQVESDKNGIRRKKLYIAFIEWAKAFNPKNIFGSVFDKDAFHTTYPFVPEEMRYFYRLANPMLCVLAGDLTFFAVAELKKLNLKNSRLNEMMIFAATPKELRVFNKKDKKIYKGIDENGMLQLKEVLGNTFDIYIQSMIKQGDILNSSQEEENE